MPADLYGPTDKTNQRPDRQEPRRLGLFIFSIEPDEQDRFYHHYQRQGALQTHSESRGTSGAGQR